jgi:DNA-binding SARP family transcriptional activator
VRLDTARSRIAGGTEDDLAAAQADLIAAVGLYQGDYLGDSLYEDWAREERERLVTRYLEGATTLADLFTRRNQLTEAIRLCEAILARDPCWEEAYVLLMRAYARQGNRRLALASYERCVRNLREHLDVAPLPQTTQVYEEVKA